MPFIINFYGLRKYTTPEHAKMQLVSYWRSHSINRDTEQIDWFIKASYERLYNLQGGDIWGGHILDEIAPAARGKITAFQGYTNYEEVKYKNKSGFLKDFYKSPKRPQY